ncbi:XRE family transcriptional regulator, partial [Kibdelosporangium lantanae]
TPGMVDRRRLWPTHGPLFASLDAPPDGQLLHLDVHEHVWVDEDRQFRQLRTKLVFEATTDRVDRCVIQLWTEEPIHPRLVEQRYCRPGRIRTDEASGATVCELMLDQRLAAGERSVVEYTWAFEPGSELTTFHRRFTRSVRQYLLQVEFDGTAPVNCSPYWQASLEAPRHVESPLWIGASNTAHLVVTDVRPGIVGLRWDWD